MRNICAERTVDKISRKFRIIGKQNWKDIFRMINIELQANEILTLCNPYILSMSICFVQHSRRISLNDRSTHTHTHTDNHIETHWKHQIKFDVNYPYTNGSSINPSINEQNSKSTKIFAWKEMQSLACMDYTFLAFDRWQNKVDAQMHINDNGWAWNSVFEFHILLHLQLKKYHNVNP